MVSEKLTFYFVIFAEKLIALFLIVSDIFLEGFKEAAEKFQEESGILSPVDLSTLDNRILIREAINAGRIQDSISLVNQLHPELLDNDRYLYFHLQQLHLIELIRDGKVEEALRFAQNKIAEAGGEYSQFTYITAGTMTVEMHLIPEKLTEFKNLKFNGQKILKLTKILIQK